MISSEEMAAWRSVGIVEEHVAEDCRVAGFDVSRERDRNFLMDSASAIGFDYTSITVADLITMDDITAVEAMRRWKAAP